MKKVERKFQTRSLDRSLIASIVEQELAMPPYDPKKEWVELNSKWDLLTYKYREKRREREKETGSIADEPKLPLPFEYCVAIAQVVEARPELRACVENAFAFQNSDLLASVGGVDNMHILYGDHGDSYGFPDYDFWQGVRISYSQYFDERYIDGSGTNYDQSYKGGFWLPGWEKKIEYISEMGEEAYLRALCEVQEDGETYSRPLV